MNEEHGKFQNNKILKQKALYLKTHDSSARSALYIFTDPNVNSLSR